jgi:hypothetical protein
MCHSAWYASLTLSYCIAQMLCSCVSVTYTHNMSWYTHVTPTQTCLLNAPVQKRISWEYSKAPMQIGYLTVPLFHSAIPVVALSKEWVCGLSIAGIACSNPARGMDVRVCLLGGLCVVQVEVSTRGRSLVQRSSTECQCVCSGQTLALYTYSG